MRTCYNTLSAAYGQCAPDCTACEDACARLNSAGYPRMRSVHLPEVNFHGVITCNQCGEPRCIEVCPTGAITKDEAGGVVRIDQARCLGCGLCDMMCPYGGVHYEASMKKAFNCDLCDGQPRCVDACEEGVLSFLKGRDIVKYLKDEDVANPGTPLCPGCPAELLLRFALRIFGRRIFFFGAPGCVATMVGGWGTQGTLGVPNTTTLMTNVPSTMTGVKRYYESLGQDVTCVAFVGDGVTVDVGFQPLSGAAERNEKIIYICYDNEGYMNTGIQSSGSTPTHGWTFTTPVGGEWKGKSQGPKYMPLIMLLHGISYVATASIAFPEDYLRKLTKALEVKDGMSYIHLISPCPTGWRFAPPLGIKISRLAVETNYFPLWEAEDGQVKMTVPVSNPNPIQEFTKLQGRFAHFDKAMVDELQTLVDKRYKRIAHLAKLKE
ncbi:MAG: thiamine pyrophosphate-dependent enzyme [Pseudomonadota bacterium]